MFFDEVTLFQCELLFFNFKPEMDIVTDRRSLIFTL
jgi:hypothetical protein